MLACKIFTTVLFVASAARPLNFTPIRDEISKKDLGDQTESDLTVQ